MLESLTVANYALIEQLEMKLSPELNIITGETGAGKSILLGALGLLLGGKNDGAATRDNTNSCIIEGQFTIGGLKLESLFEENDWEWEQSITIRRVITPSGKSRSFVGDIPVSLSALKSLSSKLIDIHSQNENQILSSEEFRIEALDLLYDSEPLLKQYRATYLNLQELRHELRDLEERAATSRRDEEWLMHQVEELTAAKLRENENEEAEAELAILENAESIGEVLNNFVSRMDSDDDRGILLMLRESQREMESITKSYPTAKEYSERLQSVIEELKDMNRSVSMESEGVEADPERLSYLTQRIDTLYSLCQKHRARDLGELIEVRDQYTEQLSMIQHSDENITNLRKKILQQESEAEKIAQEISSQRRKIAPTFGGYICETLHRLGMESARFEVVVTPHKELREMGCDKVEFLFSSVDGKSMQAVDRIASGGEISRVMLSLKALLARHKELPTIIFDEIDTGVSGRIAESMGAIISELSTKMQVIDITHLPQVASKGNSHFVVYKNDGHTNIRLLTPQQRIEHIATMLSGSEVTQAAITQAKILLRV